MRQWLLVLTLVSPYAVAQSTEDILNTVCGTQDLAWVCEARALVASTQAIVDDIMTDFRTFAEGNFERYVQEGLEYAGTQLSLGEVDTFVNDISAAVREGPEALGATLQARLDEVRREAFADTPNNYEPQSPDWWSAYARRANPNLTAAEAVTTDQRLNLLERSVQTEAAYEKAAELAETAATFNAVTQKVSEVLGTPVVGQATGLGDGEAQGLRDDAATAVSTRAGVRYLTGGVATLMEQIGTYSQDVSSKLTIQIQQQSLTNHQLNVLARTLAEERLSELAQASAELQAEVAVDYDRGEQVTETLDTTEGWMRTMFTRDVRTVLDVPGMY